MKATPTFALLLALALGGCTAGYVQNSEADVALYINAINGGQVLDSDVRTGTSGNTVTADRVTVSLANRSKNPNVTELQVARAIDVERYTVRYFRSDGRNAEGVDVPFQISGFVRSALDIGANEDVEVEVVRAQAKLDPPLTNLKGVVNGALGGSSLLLTCFAEITIYGHTTSGKAVSASSSMQIDFADFP